MKTIPHLLFPVVAVLALNCYAGTNTAKTFRYQVKVVNAAGQPVSGAVVERYRGPDWRANADTAPRLEERGTTDANGTLRFTATNRSIFTLVGQKADLSLGWTLQVPGFSDVGLDESPIELTLTEPAAVSGIVRDATGKPVADATVWVRAAYRAGNGPSWAPLNSRLGRKYLTARTGSDGKFQLAGLPADASLDLAVAKPGFALDEAPRSLYSPFGSSFEAGQSNIVLTLKPSGALEGQIVQEETGAAVAGARVFLGDNELNDSTESSTTGSNGRFSLTDLSPGEYKLRVAIGTNQFADWVCDTLTASVEAGATNRDLKLTAVRGGVLEVTVHSQPNSQPVGGATVALSREMLNQVTTTSDEGVARLRLIPGQYHLFAVADGFKGHQSQTTVEPGQTNQLEFTLETATRLAGTVVGPDGKPAPRVNVSVFPFAPNEKTTDSQGRFSVSSDGGQFGGGPSQRFLFARDFAHNLATAFELDEESTNATLRLEPALTVVGRVTDEKGKPIPGASAQVMFRTQRMSTSLGRPVSANAEGRFEIKALPANHPYYLTVSAKGFGQEQRNIEAQTPGSGPVEVEPVQLPLADRRIAGVVVDADEKPVASAWVNGSGEKQPHINGRTDSKGRFAFEHVCAGQIQLSASNQRAYGNVVAEGGDTNITIQLGVSQAVYPGAGGSSKLAGTITDPEGKPAAKVTVLLFPFHGSDKRTDAEGRFKLSYDPHQWSSTEAPRILIARDLARNLATALEVEPEATNANLKLAPGLTITGRITDTQGKPLTNAEAQLMFRTERIGSSLGTPVRVDSEGRFEIKALPTGRRYSVTASAKGFGRDDRSIEPGEGETRATLEPLQLAVADQRIAGVVLDADDKPVANASLYCYDDKQPQLNGQTDAKGRFSFDKVCAGPIRFSVNAPGGGGYANVSAEGGDTNITVRLRSSSGQRADVTRVTSLRGKPLPDLTSLGLTAADCPADQPVLALLIDAEQRPSRRALRLLGEQAAALKQKGIAVVVLQAGAMAEEAFTSWKQEAAVPFPVGRLKGEPEKTRAAWGAGALPWLILTDKAHRVTAEGFAPEELDAKLKNSQ